MTLTQLALKDISRNVFRSWTIFLCAVLVAGLAVSTALITKGARDSLRLTQGRLGADVLVVPEGSETSVETALLMGKPAEVWMPEKNLARVRELPGVAAASPQLYLASLSNASCCAVSEMFMVAFDPKTDFTIQPWLEENLGEDLGVGDVVCGTHVSATEGDSGIKLYGYDLTIRANLEPTGGSLDESLFLTMDTAREISKVSEEAAEKPLRVPRDEVSAILVKVDEGSDPAAVALLIDKELSGVTAVVSPQMFGTFRDQMSAIVSSFVLMLSITLGMSLLLIGAVFSMATHERRREIGVLRALGARRRHIVGHLLLQALVLAAAGAATGTVAGAVGIYLFHDHIVNTAGIPFLFPSLPALLPTLAIGVGIALLAALAASYAPAAIASKQEPAMAMRE